MWGFSCDLIQHLLDKWQEMKFDSLICCLSRWFRRICRRMIYHEVSWNAQEKRSQEGDDDQQVLFTCVASFWWKSRWLLKKNTFEQICRMSCPPPFQDEIKEDSPTQDQHTFQEYVIKRRGTTEGAQTPSILRKRMYKRMYKRTHKRNLHLIII